MCGTGVLKKLCNHPELLRDAASGEDDDDGVTLTAADLKGMGDIEALKAQVQAGFTSSDIRLSATEGNPKALPEFIQMSGKLTALQALLTEVRRDTADRVVLVSNYTSTLDALQSICDTLKYVRE